MKVLVEQVYLVFCARAFVAQEYFMLGIEHFVLGYFVPRGISYLVFMCKCIL